MGYNIRYFENSDSFLEKGSAQSLPKVGAKGGASRTQRSRREFQKKLIGRLRKSQRLEWKEPWCLSLWVKESRTERLELVQAATKPETWGLALWSPRSLHPRGGVEGGGISGKAECACSSLSGQRPEQLCWSVFSRRLLGSVGNHRLPEHSDGSGFRHHIFCRFC